MSNIPIHQDGSCNGLQHYAALGGDVDGAKAVSLIPSDKPGDVYSGISKRVQELVDKDFSNGVKEAILCKSRINRKLVKQTVMVTFVDFRQILTELLLLGQGDKLHHDFEKQGSMNPPRINFLMNKLPSVQYISPERFLKLWRTCLEVCLLINSK